MQDKIIRLSESDLHSVIMESVHSILNELDWKTYMNASRKRKGQADDMRSYIKSVIPGSQFKYNNYDDKSDELEKYSGKVFNKQHGRDGKEYNYEGDSSDYQGRSQKYDVEDDWGFSKKNPVSSKWKDDDGEIVVVRRYRNGKGVPTRNSGSVYDDTFDFTEHPKIWTGSRHRQHTLKYDKDGEHYDSYNSSVGDEVSQSKDKDYNDRQFRMGRDMENYYTGKSKYNKGKGWE